MQLLRVGFGELSGSLSNLKCQVRIFPQTKHDQSGYVLQLTMTRNVQTTKTNGKILVT